MGNKIITEKDFWMCTGGNVPAQLQSTQLSTKKKDGKKYITLSDTATSSMMDFGCNKLMLIMAIVAAVIAVCVVATGGAALIAIGALAGAAGAAVGAVMGGLICGQVAAMARMWLASKNNLKIQGKPAITGDHQMQCMLFGDKITFAPNIKNWWQAIALGGANYIGGIMEGMMAGAAVGMGGAFIGGARTAFLQGGTRAVGQAGLNFLKVMPKNFGVNLLESVSKFGLAMRGVMGAQNTAATYGNTGTASIGDFAQGTVAMETGAYDSANLIYADMSGGVVLDENGEPRHAGWQDYVGMVMMFAPVGKGKRDIEAELSKKADEAEGKKADEESTKKATNQEGESAKKDGDHEAFEADSMKRESKTNSNGERIMTVREMKLFEKQMADIGVKVEYDTKGKVLKGENVAGYDSKTKTMYLKKPPSTYEATHESHHAKQHNKLGDEAYNKQNRIDKEKHVRDELMKNKEILTEKQINHADAYIKYVENGYWPPKDVNTGLYILN